MKRYLIIATLFLGACTSFMGKTNYVPTGPQDLSRQVQDAKNMPVFSGPVDIPSSRIGFYQVQKLPNDQKVIKKEVEKMKEFAAKRGADAIILRQYTNEDDAAYPVNLSSYFLKYLENMTPEDEQKIIDFINTSVVSGDDR